MVDYKYSIFGKQYGFKPITTQDALRIRNVSFILAKDNANFEDLEKVNNVIDNIAIKYLVIKDESGTEFDNLNFNTLQTIFNDNENAPFVMVEIQKQFMELVGGFLQALPSFQRLQSKK
ncbi:TPA: hypothetical protein RTG66_001558 [Campylobacter jejuni]|nr:hypothetical protein [Campylobacter jejuni]